MGATTHFLSCGDAPLFGEARGARGSAGEGSRFHRWYWKLGLINGAVFVAATALLVVSPATVSVPVMAAELTMLATGLAPIR
jgi:hypothetical protein